MLKGDQVCSCCGRLIFSYTKRRVDLEKWRYQCPHCRSWNDMERMQEKVEAIFGRDR